MAAASPRPKPKRATAPLDAAARARLAVFPGSVESSGSEHEGAALSSLVNEYLLQADSTVHAHNLTQEGSDAEDGHGDGAHSIAVSDVVEEIKGALNPGGGADDLRRRLASDVADAMHGLDDVRPNRSAFRRAVMSRLRERGHDAGLCKARWDKSSSVTAGSYEYIDVLAAGETRFIVDVGFVGEFEVARPTDQYEVVRAALPEVLVARPEDVKKVIKVAASAARRSLKSSGLSVPPWRKRRFMLAKWMGPYKRTVNSVTESAGAAVACSGAAPVCRTIFGFAPPPPSLMTFPVRCG